MRTPIALPVMGAKAKKTYPFISAIDLDGKMYRLCGAVSEKSALEIARANIRLHPDEITGTRIVFSEGMWRACCGI